MEILRTNWSLAEWQKHLDNLYGNVNKERSPRDVFGRLLEMMGGLCRGVRDNDKEKIKTFSPRTLAWLLAYAERLKVDLEPSLAHWFPGVCPHCRAQRDCKCILGHREKERLKDGPELESLRDQFRTPSSLQDWLSMFNRIFGFANREVGVAKIFMHILEELGENNEALRHRLTTKPTISAETIQQHTEQELCDLFAWYAAVVNLELPEVDAYMKDIYFEHCPDCGNNPCGCAPDFVHPTFRLTGRTTKAV